MLTQFIQDIEPYFYRRYVLYVDIGAFKGEVYSAFIHSGLNVRESHLFEPHPGNFAQLRAKVEKERGAARAVCHNLALGANGGDVRMRFASDMTKVLDPASVGQISADNLFNAECSTLDTVANLFTRRHISILKVDVEGYELEVLQGAHQLLKDASIDVIYLEAGINPSNPQQCYYRDIEDKLGEFGYRLFRIYEQKHEWQDDSPLLRRVNMAFMSRPFADNNPYRLTRELYDAHQEVERLGQQLKSLELERDQIRRQAMANEQLALNLRDQLAEETSKQKKTEAQSASELLNLRALTKRLEAETRSARKEAKADSERVAKLRALVTRERQSRGNRIRAAQDSVKRQLSYRIGSTLVAASRSPLRLIRLPLDLVSQYQAYRLEHRALCSSNIPVKVSSSNGNAMERRLLTAKERWGGYGLVAEAEAGQLDINRLKPESFAEYLHSLTESYEYQQCVEAFERRYPSRDISRLHSLGGRSLAPYLRSLLRCGRPEVALELVNKLRQAYPAHTRYWSLSGYILAGSNPALAREQLRKALKLGSRSQSDVLLVYRTLLAQGLPLSEVLPEAEDYVRQRPDNADALDNFNFMRSTIAQDRGETSVALSELNSYLSRHGLAELHLVDPEAGFGMDNLHSDQVMTKINDGPLLSVLMTTYNSEGFIDSAIRSVLAQTYTNFELIITDDCSQDGTRVKLAKWAAEDNRIRVLHNCHNIGTYGSKNLGLHIANGEFITCHDSDDWSHPEKFARQMAHMLSSDAIACSSRWARIDERGYFESKRWGKILHLNPSSLLFRRAAVEAIGYFDTVRTGADTEFHHRIQTHYGVAAVHDLKLCMALGRSRSDSLTRVSGLGFDEFGASPLRQAYWLAWGAWHRRFMRDDSSPLYIGFPPTSVRPFPAPSEITPEPALAAGNVAALQHQD